MIGRTGFEIGDSFLYAGMFRVAWTAPISASGHTIHPLTK